MSIITRARLIAHQSLAKNASREGEQEDKVTAGTAEPGYSVKAVIVNLDGMNYRPDRESVTLQMAELGSCMTLLPSGR